MGLDLDSFYIIYYQYIFTVRSIYICLVAVVAALRLIIPKKTATTGGGGGAVGSSTVISYVDTRDQ
jgi:hypothetical protein